MIKTTHRTPPHFLFFLLCTTSLLLVNGSVYDPLVGPPSPLAADNITDVFSANEGGYMCIRIPVLITTSSADNIMIAFAEARGLHSKNYNCCVSPVMDYPWCTDKDIVSKTSMDGGRTWGPLRLFSASNSTYFFSNPAPIYDPATKDVVMLYTRCETAKYYNSCDLWLSRSSDLSQSWSASVSVQGKAGVSNGLCGPPGGLLVPRGGAGTRSRLLWSMHTHDPTKGQYCLYSDENGQNIKEGSIVPDGGAGESQMVTLPSGTILQTIRRIQGGEHVFTTSQTGGETWSSLIIPKQLPQTDCQASLVVSRSGIPLFSTVAASAGGHRANLTIYESIDKGAAVEWKPYKLVYPGPSGYSSMVETSRQGIAILYERGLKSPYEFISLSFV
eukprot:TRINITY_DN4939_c0_g1_i3.p1 TRINITY_DN4939_c0_g1~~TRINITY_DN4939_c0_g1_i3.p1  ORF type:complete len:387 (+),score=43.76 TRINITY_DN4939_c0_g1_i3:13-1173(+)